MRIFFALPLSGEAAVNLAAALERFRAQAPQIRWEVPEALHVTLKFIGAWPEAEEGRILAVVGKLPIPVLRLRLAGLGAFPDRRRARTIWAGVHATHELAGLARELDEVLQPLGIAPETHPFVPHVSLGRVRRPGDLGPLRRQLDEEQPVWGETVGGEVILYETLSGCPPGERYRPRARFGAASQSSGSSPR